MKNTILNAYYGKHLSPKATENMLWKEDQYNKSKKFTNFKIYFMKTNLKIILAFMLCICYGSLFADGSWQQKLELINPSDNAANSEIEVMPNGNCLIATNFNQPWDTAIYLHQYKKENGEILLFDTKYVMNKNVQKVHAIKYIASIQKYILIYEEYTTGFAGICYQIIDSFEPFVIQPKHVLYAFNSEDLYSNKLIVTETNSAIEAGFSTTSLDAINNKIRDTIRFHRVKILFSNLDTVAQNDSLIIPNKYSSSSIQYGLYTMKKVQNDYILNVSNLDNETNVYYVKLINIHDDLSWDSASVYYPNGFISPQLLNNGNLLVKNNFRQNSSNDGYSTTDVYNSSLQKLYSIDSTSLPGNAAIFLEPSEGKVINIEGDYYPNQFPEYGMVKEIIDIKNRKVNKQEVWHINYPEGISFRNFNIISQTNFVDGYAYLFGLIAGPNNRNLYLIRIDSLGNVYSNLIRGNVMGDLNNDCVFDEGADINMRNITLTANIDSNVLYTSTDNYGNYQFATNASGNIKVASRNNFRYPLWKSGNCNDTINVFLGVSSGIDSINFNFTPSIICKNLTIDGFLRRFRHLDPVFYDISYCNTGTVSALDAYIELKVDPILVLDNITSNGIDKPFTDLGNNIFRIDIGSVSIFDCGNFTAHLHEKPEAVLGQTVCMESHIYPDDVCTETRYDGAIIEASATCLGDSVRLQLKNRGKAMQGPKKYFVIEDQVIRLLNTYNLPSNGVLAEIFASDSGKTYRITAEQETNFPNELGNRFVTAAIEGCRPSQENQFSTGNILPFPNYDGAPYFSTDCKMIVGSFDPNEKGASPVGYGEQHFIEENTDIDYTLYFQNTGNDTAYKVVLIDTISSNLEINTLVPLVASHNYKFERIDSNVVRFVFDSIYLVDSFHNEPLSHGYVKFSIQQKKDNPIDAKIYNNAYIYFDKNPPIITNTVFHTIGEEFIEVKLISSTFNTQYNVKSIKVFPNPFRERTQIVIDSDELENPSLMLVNMQGQIVKVISTTNKNTFNIEREDLSNGMYFFKIMEGEQEVGNGKIIVQ